MIERPIISQPDDQPEGQLAAFHPLGVVALRGLDAFVPEQPGDFFLWHVLWGREDNSDISTIDKDIAADAV